MILSTHISSQLSDTCRPTVSAHTESAGGWLQFLESSAFKWNSYKILQSSFQRKKNKCKKIQISFLSLKSFPTQQRSWCPSADVPILGCRVTCCTRVLSGFLCPRAPRGYKRCSKGFRGAQPQSVLARCLGGCEDVFPPCIVYYLGNYMPSDGHLHTARTFRSSCEFALNPSVTFI